jgi:iron complex outermembrane receptor protein
VYDGSNPDPNVLLSTGELVNVIDTAATDSRLSICADGTDCGSDQDNNGFPDDLAPMDGNLDQGRVNNQFQLTPGGDFFGYKDPDGEDWTFSGDFAFEDQGSTETFGVALRVEWDLSDSMTLTSITDFKDYEKLVFIDVDSAPVNQSANYAGVDADSTTQEIRVNGTTDKTSWVAGFYYLNIDTDSDNGLKFPVNSTVSLGGPLPGILPPGPFDLGVDAQLKTDSYSLFGQVDWELVDNWTLIVGARVVQEEKDYHFEQNVYYNSDSRTVNQSSSDAPIPGPIIIGPVGSSPADFAPFDDSSSDTLWAGKLQVDWRPNDDWLLYAGLNRGVKAGSFNAQLAGGLPIAPADIPYGDETLHSIETGFKSTWADGRTRFNGTFFYYDYSDYQAFLFTGVGGVVINADVVRCRGSGRAVANPAAGGALNLHFRQSGQLPGRRPGVCTGIPGVGAHPLRVAGFRRHDEHPGRCDLLGFVLLQPPQFRRGSVRQLYPGKRLVGLDEPGGALER